MESDLYKEMFETEEHHWWFAARREIVLEMIHRYSDDDNGLRILDLGCGCGYTLLFLSGHYKDVIGLDNSDDALQFCRVRGIKAMKGSLPDDVPFEKGSFDVILLMDVLEHVENDRGTVAAAAELLKPGGIIVATVPAHRFMWTRRDDFHHHLRRYSKAEGEKLFDAPSLSRKLLSFYNTILFLPMLANRLAGKILNLDKEGPDIWMPAKPLNFLLEKIFAGERHLLGRIPMITGASLIAVYEKKK